MSTVPDPIDCEGAVRSLSGEDRSVAMTVEELIGSCWPSRSAIWLGVDVSTSLAGPPMSVRMLINEEISEAP